MKRAKEEASAHWKPLGKRMVAENINRHLTDLGVPESEVLPSRRELRVRPVQDSVLISAWGSNAL